MFNDKSQIDYGLKYQKFLEKTKLEWATERLRHKKEQKIRKSFFYDPLHPPISEEIVGIERRLDDLESRYSE